MKVAVDVQISNSAVQIFESSGFKVVYKAHDNEPDAEWFDIAIACGAEIFVSPDTDILVMAGNAGYSYVQLPSQMRASKITYFVLKKLKAIDSIRILYNQNPQISYCRRK